MERPHPRPNLASRPSAGILGNERMSALSDGIFAIVLTLLVLEVKVPEAVKSVEELNLALSEIWPKVLGYVISFVVIGLYWIIQHTIFQSIKRHDRPLLWLNLVFLMCVASMPFPSALIVRYPDAQAPVIIMAAGFITTGLALDLVWWYASTHQRLVDQRVTPTLIKLVHQRLLGDLIFHLAAIGLSFVSVPLAKLMFVLSVGLYILPSRLSAYHHQQTGTSGDAHSTGNEPAE